MPFDSAVKSAMFVRCNRICCLCFKQRGANIEAAHIIAEAEGGSNDEDNGIPLCFDCHQEIGAYDDRHPRGNKFRPDELRARRDQVYKWVAGGRTGELSLTVKVTDCLPSPVHQIIDLLTRYHSVLGQVHHSRTNEAGLALFDKWRECHYAVWGNSSGRDDTIRKLADPAKEWLTQIKCPYVHLEDFDLVEQSAQVLSGFAVSPLPMRMPDDRSNARSTEDEHWQQWKEQGDRYLDQGRLIARLKELTARAGQRWNPSQ